MLATTLPLALSKGASRSSVPMVIAKVIDAVFFQGDDFNPLFERLLSESTSPPDRPVPLRQG